MADQDLTINIKATTDELKDALEAVNDVFKKASEAAKALSQTVDGDVSSSLKAASAEGGALGASLEAAFSPLAIVGFISAVVDAGEKISKFISDTFIYTDAEKKADEQLKSENKTLAELAEKTKQVRRERELANATTASEKDKIKLKFQIEDDGGTADQLKEKIAATVAQINKLRPLSLKKELTDSYDEMGNLIARAGDLTADAQEKKAEMDQLSASLSRMQAQANAARQQQGAIEDAQKRHEAEEAERAKAEQERRHQEALAAFERAQQKQIKSFMDGLQQKKDALDAFHTMTKADEVRYWDDILAHNKVAGQNLAQIHHLRAEAQKDADRKALHDEVENVEEQVAATKAGSRERITILEAEIDKLESEGKTETEEYKRLVRQKITAVRELAQAAEEAAKKQQQIEHEIQKIGLTEQQEHAKVERDFTQQEADFEVQMGRMTAQQRHAIAKQALDDEHKDQVGAINDQMRLLAQAGQKETAEYATLHKQLTKIDDDYRKNSAKLNQQWLLQQKQQYQQYFNQFNSALNGALNGWIQGTESASKAFEKMFQNILMQLVSFVEQWIEKKVEMWLMDQILSHTSQDATATAEIASNAAVAASGAYAATAQIPITGPEMAPFAAMQAYFDVMEMQSLAKFARGGIVPSTGLALVHGGEMVLPAPLSHGIGQLIGGGTNAGSPIHVHVHHNVNAIDSASFKDTIRRHGHIIGEEVARVLKKKTKAASAY